MINLFTLLRQLAAGFMLTGLLFSFPLSANDNPKQDHEQIRGAIRDFLAASNTDINTDDDIEVGIIDPRLKLAHCESSLKVFLPNGNRASGQTTVGVRCTGVKPWLIYVTATASVTRPVVVAVRALPHGAVIGPDDIQLQPKDVASMVTGYLDNPELAIGKVVKRPMTIGTVIRPNSLKFQHLVKRGDRVQMRAKTAGFSVSMAGKALANGAKGEQIQVENLSSGRVVTATVTGDRVVEVPM